MLGHQSLVARNRHRSVEDNGGVFVAAGDYCSAFSAVIQYAYRIELSVLGDFISRERGRAFKDNDPAFVDDGTSVCSGSTSLKPR